MFLVVLVVMVVLVAVVAVVVAVAVEVAVILWCCFGDPGVCQACASSS